MNIQDILNKKASERTAEEVEFLKTADLNDEQKAKLASEVQGETKEEAKTETKETPDAETKEEAKTDTKDVVTASEGMVTVKASELETLQKAREELATLQANENKRKITEHVNAFVANEKGGKILAKQAEALTEIYLASDEAMRAKLDAFVKGLNDIKIAGEVGVASSEGVTPEGVEARFIKELDAIKASEKVNEAKAQDLLMKRNPELYAEYKKLKNL